MTPRQHAVLNGLKQYVTGKPCRAGHLAPRLTVNNCCMECNRLKAIAYRAANPDKAANDSKKYRAKNPTRAAEDGRKYYAANKETEKARKSAYRKANLPRYRELDRRRNKEKVAKNAARRARKNMATPSWLTADQHQQMRAFYKATPADHEVDHIVPLISDIVCGLHVPWNLQYLTVEDNRKKGNKLL